MHKQQQKASWLATSILQRNYNGASAQRERNPKASRSCTLSESCQLTRDASVKISKEILSDALSFRHQNSLEYSVATESFHNPRNVLNHEEDLTLTSSKIISQ
ncbi:hypothetical protein AVEN_226028-1 [Araneus ventricosus]|uniref:Uncharacterized protein n=1 Tax=Araneus ventricosus TaxID=182803 RepID=A0A4Y2HQW1_ARAVE|nr:hypothetical protein AVEN_226028-1 [Araneus ventricosus]